jgi:hypothetical protein
MDISMHCAMMWVNLQRQVSALPKYAPQIFPCHVLLHISCTILQFNETETYNLMCEGYKRDREKKNFKKIVKCLHERGEIGVVAVAGRGSEQKRFGGVDVPVNQRRTRRSYGEK